jgi:hypothetical protein
MDLVSREKQLSDQELNPIHPLLSQILPKTKIQAEGGEETKIYVSTSVPRRAIYNFSAV